MNPHPCRRHFWIADRCILCGAGDPHRHCYEERHACAWYEPTEWDQPRKGSR